MGLEAMSERVELELAGCPARMDPWDIECIAEGAWELIEGDTPTDLARSLALRVVVVDWLSETVKGMLSRDTIYVEGSRRPEDIWADILHECAHRLVEQAYGADPSHHDVWRCALALGVKLSLAHRLLRGDQGLALPPVPGWFLRKRLELLAVLVAETPVKVGA